MGCGCKSNREKSRKWLRFGGINTKPCKQSYTGNTKNNTIINK